eukprot:1194183-Prorocentrum_minimum.AAC.4
MSNWAYFSHILLCQACCACAQGCTTVTSPMLQESEWNGRAGSRDINAGKKARLTVINSSKRQIEAS